MKNRLKQWALLLAAAMLLCLAMTGCGSSKSSGGGGSAPQQNTYTQGAGLPEYNYEVETGVDGSQTIKDESGNTTTVATAEDGNLQITATVSKEAAAAQLKQDGYTAEVTTVVDPATGAKKSVTQTVAIDPAKLAENTNGAESILLEMTNGLADLLGESESKLIYLTITTEYENDQPTKVTVTYKSDATGEEGNSTTSEPWTLEYDVITGDDGQVTLGTPTGGTDTVDDAGTTKEGLLNQALQVIGNSDAAKDVLLEQVNDAEKTADETIVVVTNANTETYGDGTLGLILSGMQAGKPTKATLVISKEMANALIGTAQGEEYTGVEDDIYWNIALTRDSEGNLTQIKTAEMPEELAAVLNEEDSELAFQVDFKEANLTGIDVKTTEELTAAELTLTVLEHDTEDMEQTSKMQLIVATDKDSKLRVVVLTATGDTADGTYLAVEFNKDSSLNTLTLSIPETAGDEGETTAPIKMTVVYNYVSDGKTEITCTLGNDEAQVIYELTATGKNGLLDKTEGTMKVQQITGSAEESGTLSEAAGKVKQVALKATAALAEAGAGDNTGSSTDNTGSSDTESTYADAIESVLEQVLLNTSTTYTHNGAALQSVKSTASTSVELDGGLKIALEDKRTLQYSTSAGKLSTYTGKATVTTNLSELGLTGFDTISAGLTANLTGKTKTLTATLDALPGLALEVTLGNGAYPILKANGTTITSKYTAENPWKSSKASITRSYFDEQEGKTKSYTNYIQYMLYLDSKTIETTDEEGNKVTKTVPVLMFDMGTAYNDEKAEPKFSGNPTPFSMADYDPDEIQAMLLQIQEGTKSSYEAYPTLSRLLLQGTLANS